ncbi:MAG: translation initiation factor IF-2 N-terminal domain-containing protein, partial [Mycobacteriaceae bacterium]
MADQAPPEDFTQLNADIAALPERLRVHALAKTLGVTSKQVLAALAELGENVRSAQSSIDKSAAEQVFAALFGAQPEPAAPVVLVPESVSEVTPAAAPLFLQPQPVVRATRVKKESALEDNAEEATAEVATARRRRTRRTSKNTEAEQTPVGHQTELSVVEMVQVDVTPEVGELAESDTTGDAGEEESTGNRRRRRGRRGRGRGRSDLSPVEDGSLTAGAERTDDSEVNETPESSSPVTDSEDELANEETGQADAEAGVDPLSRRRRRRRRRKVGSGETDLTEDISSDDPPNTVVHEREPRNKSRNRDEVQGIAGSTRLEAKRQRRRDGRDTGRRRPPILTESEFLARRESVDRVMVVRERLRAESGKVTRQEDYTQVAVLEDGVLVEHFVTTSSSASMVGNIYLGRVQNVLPSMEAAFVD